MKLLFADFHALSREGIRSVLSKIYPDITFDEAFSRQQLLSLVANNDFDIVIVDPVSFDEFDFSDIALLRAQKPKTLFLIFTTDLDGEIMSQAMDYSVNGFLTKECDTAEFSKSIEQIVAGKKYYCQEVTEYLFKMHSRDKQFDNSLNKKQLLTTKEEEIVRLIGEGLSAKEVADRLFISVHTANTHRKNIYRKCGVRNASELVMYAVKSGIIERIEYYI